VSPTKAPDRPGVARRSPHPAVDPRIRSRRAAVARREGRRRLWVLVGLLAVSAAVVGGWSLLHSRWFDARVVTVVGADHTPVPEIERVAGVAHHPPLLDVDPGAVAARLERLPWISQATVSRQWPDGLRIAVTERMPVAVMSTAPPATPVTPSAAPAPAGARPAGATAPTPAAKAPAAGAPGWALIDRSGRVLADVASPPAHLVRLAGAAAPGAPGADLAPLLAPGIAVASSLPKAFAAQVTAVDVGAGGQVTLTLTTPVTISLGTATQLPKKYEDAAAILAGAKLVRGDVIDVSVPDSPTVGPR
jgi:cell division protein FtsQ